MSEQIQPGVGYTFTNVGKGSSLTIDSQVQWYPDIPLTVQNAGSDAVYIIPGTVNQLIPMVGGTYIDALPRPTISVSANGYIILRVSRVANEPFPDSPVIYYNATIPTNTTTNGYFRLASVTLVGNATTGYSINITNYRSQYIGAVSVGRQKFGNNATYYWWA